MKLKALFDYAVAKGISADLRSPGRAKKLKSRGNPYGDTAILYGAPQREIQTILVGIDIEVSEILLADRLNQNGAGIDLVLGHHPAGKALASLAEVMDIHISLLENAGVPHDVAAELIAERAKEVQRSVASRNHLKTVDAARLLDIPLVCAHTVADNFVNRYLQQRLERLGAPALKDIIAGLRDIEEYAQAAEQNAGPMIISGDENSRAGRIMVEMTGGTEGAKQAFAHLRSAGVDTLVVMHLSEEHLKIARAEHVNIIMAGHIASDNLGLNLLLDELCKKEPLNILCCSGFRRVERYHAVHTR